MTDKFLITGGQGFFGAHIAKMLLEKGAVPVIFDLKPMDGILKQVLSEDQLTKLERIYGDISDGKLVTSTVLDVAPKSIIHLAGLQIPTCKVNPVLGANVNVIGTINVFEAAKALAEKTGEPAPKIVYASSAAVLGPSADYPAADLPLKDDYFHKPRTLYGVFKIANEGTARLYFQEHKISSVGLRPLTCFGVGREVGMTSAPTKAIKAALLGREYKITFQGMTGWSYIEDIAKIFIGCATSTETGAKAFNVRGEMTTVEFFVEELCKAIPEAKPLISIDGPEIPIMADVDESELVKVLRAAPSPYTVEGEFPTPIVEAIKKTAKEFQILKENGKLTDHDL